MKKVLTILLLLLVLPCVLADGMIHVYDMDAWRLIPEGEQYCAIGYKDGLESMILTVSSDETLSGSKAVWIFPIPSNPKEVVIDILKGFPQMTGYNLEDRSKESVSEAFTYMRASQVYALPLIMFTTRLTTLKGMAFQRAEEELGEVVVYESIEKMGLTTELISTSDDTALAAYLSDKGLQLEEGSKDILNEYAGKDYAFVVSWISDLKKFQEEQKEGYNSRRGQREFMVDAKNILGVSITFPTSTIYYPLKLTSVYGSKNVPTVIYVMDYVEPSLYPEIRSYTEVDYYFLERSSSFPSELKSVFRGYEQSSYPKYSYDTILHEDVQQGEWIVVEDVKYTKIKIDAPSKYLKEDLWLQVSTPSNVEAWFFLSKYPAIYGIAIFIICSCLASLFAGMIIFRYSALSKIKLMLLGLSNFLSLIGFGISTFLISTKNVNEDFRNYISKLNVDIFEDNSSRYYKVIFIFLMFIIFSILISNLISRYSVEAFVAFSTFIAAWIMFFLCFSLSTDCIKEEHRLHISAKGVSIKVFDVKKFVYLLSLNLALIITALFLFESLPYQSRSGLAEAIAGDPNNEEILFLLIPLLSFIISTWILVYLDRLLKDKCGSTWIHVLQKDSRKVWFVALFTVFFMLLTVIFEIGLKIFFNLI